MTIIGDLKDQFRKGTNLLKLIYINAAVFIVMAVLQIISVLSNNPSISSSVVEFLAVPASSSNLLIRPWTILTYMFLHEGFFHLLFNMLWLYWFGRIFSDYFDQKKIVSVYILGGLSGALLYILSFNIFPAFSEVIHVSIALGASASVIAIVVATAAYVPDYSVHLFLIGRVKIKYIALGIFLLTSIFDFSVNTGGKIAHIGGAIFGYIYAIRYKQGKDTGKWVSNIIDGIATWFKPRKKMKVSYKKPMTDIEYNKMKTDHHEQINRILEKISKGGYDSLTKEEKEILFKESQK
ncbi:MAG TPA: rhomboid family intramembrane serine protease [Bacteroidales bacterium]|nr:rhomboid family intramembrane serine protease [Bacteroidales bacterium]